MRLAEVEKRLSERFPNGFTPISKIPQPSLLKDSEKASNRIAKAVKNRERITVIGDYDVDGVTSSSIIFLFFKELGVDIEIIIPNRFKDGYGITPHILNRVDADLVITVDNGIHGFESAEILKDRKVDLIITDHHNPSDQIPNAFAVVNPKQKDCQYPYKDICGAQVIWLLLAEVKKVLKSKIDMSQYLDLLAIAIISDVMPMTNLNHSFVKRGLEQFPKNRRFANQVLMERIFIDKKIILSDDIGFQVAPRLNSSGRMEDAILSFQFLVSDNYFDAVKLFERIDELNQNRKEVEKDIFKKVAESVDNSHSIILHYGENLHEGVIGIVASRIVEKFQKPAFIFSLKDGVIKGSGRTLGNLDIFKILQESKHLFLKWGGHKMAGGVSMKVENFEKFRESAFNTMNNFKKDDFLEISKVFGELNILDVDFKLFTVLNRFEPFGNMNEKPIFQLSDVLVKQSYRIGKDKQFQKIVIEKNSKTIDVVVFSDIDDILIGETISFTYRPNINKFRNKTTVQALFDKIVI